MPGEEGPDYIVEAWDTGDGLPQNSVTCLIQSRAGYLWFGTQNGLVRTDGLRFKVHSTETARQMPGNRVLCVFEDSDGVLWFGVEGGGAGCIQDGGVKSQMIAALKDTSVTSITEGPAGTLWFGTVRGEVIRWSAGLVRVFGRESGLPRDPIRNLAVDRSGKLWAATSGWLGRIAEGMFEEQARDASGELVFAMRREGGLWVVVDGRLVQWELDGKKTSWEIPVLPKKERQPLVLLENRKGEVWIGMNGGGFLRFSEGRVESVRHQQSPLPSEVVLTLAEDHEGNLWAGTLGGGLIRLRQRLFTVVNSRHGLAEINVLTVCEGADGGMWFGTDGGGVHRLARDGQMARFHGAHGLLNEHVSAVCEDRRGTLWAGTWGGGLFLLRDGRFTRFGDTSSFDAMFIRALYEDPQGRVWIGTFRSGVVCQDGGQLTSYAPTNGLSHPDVSAILCDGTGAMWFGTGGGGLNRLKDGRMEVFTVAHGLPSDFIRVLFEDAQGVLWIGTEGGLACRKDGRFMAIKASDGLPDHVISQIFRDGRGAIWFGSNRGIFRASVRELEEFAERRMPPANFLTYTKADGISGSECNGGFQPSGCQTRDGRLWFPTLQGVTVVDPTQLRINPRPPRVKIEDVVADGTVLAPGEDLQVPAGCQRLLIQFTGISLSAPRRVRLRYRLSNTDPDWVEAGILRTAAYNRLPPGNYNFQVRAANSDGVWNETGSTLAFTVAAPFWRTWWFLGVAGVGATGAFAAVIRWVSLRKMRRNLEHLEHQNAIERDRSRIAADMHDELGSRLTRIGLLGALARRDAARPDQITGHLDNITIQSAELAKSLDEIVWTVNPRNDTLDRLAAYIVHYAEEFYDASPIRCRLDVPADLPALPLSAERRHNLFMAFKEALNNVAKHSGATEVHVRLAVLPPWIELSVRDDGCGFEGPKPDGDGLLNMKTRLAAMDGEFEMTTSPGGGTMVALRLKLLGLPEPSASPSSKK
ncbi:MAG: two-component regulator propeller domain-containing protein [Limisphaerales bacterium]